MQNTKLLGDGAGRVVTATGASPGVVRREVSSLSTPDLPSSIDHRHRSAILGLEEATYNACVGLRDPHRCMARNGYEVELQYEAIRNTTSKGRSGILSEGYSYQTFWEYARSPQAVVAEVLAGIILVAWLFFLLPITCCWCFRKPIVCIAKHRHQWSTRRLISTCAAGAVIALGAVILCIAAEVEMQRAINGARAATCSGFRLLETGIVGTERQKHSLPCADSSPERVFPGVVFLVRQPNSFQASLKDTSISKSVDAQLQLIAEVMGCTSAQKKARGHLQELSIHLASAKQLASRHNHMHAASNISGLSELVYRHTVTLSKPMFDVSHLSKWGVGQGGQHGPVSLDSVTHKVDEAAAVVSKAASSALPALQLATNVATIVCATEALVLLVLILAGVVCVGSHYASQGSDPKPLTCIVWNLFFLVLVFSLCLTSLLWCLYLAMEDSCSEAVDDAFLDSWVPQGASGLSQEEIDARSAIRECFGSAGTGTLLAIPNIRKRIDAAYKDLATAKAAIYKQILSVPRMPQTREAEIMAFKTSGLFGLALPDIQKYPEISKDPTSRRNTYPEMLTSGVQWEDTDVVVGGMKLRIHGLQTVERLVAPWTLSLGDEPGGSDSPSSTSGSEKLLITASGPDEKSPQLNVWLTGFEAQEARRYRDEGASATTAARLAALSKIRKRNAILWAHDKLALLADVATCAHYNPKSGYQDLRGCSGRELIANADTVNTSIDRTLEAIKDLKSNVKERHGHAHTVLDQVFDKLTAAVQNFGGSLDCSHMRRMLADVLILTCVSTLSSVRRTALLRFCCAGVAFLMALLLLSIWIMIKDNIKAKRDAEAELRSSFVCKPSPESRTAADFPNEGTALGTPWQAGGDTVCSVSNSAWAAVPNN